MWVRSLIKKMLLFLGTHVYFWFHRTPVVDTWAVSPARFLSPSQVRLTDQSLTLHCWSLPRSLQAETRLHQLAKSSHASKSHKYPTTQTTYTGLKALHCFRTSEGRSSNNIMTSPIYQALVLHSDIAQDKCIKTLIQHSKAVPRQGNKRNWQLRVATHKIH